MPPGCEHRKRARPGHERPGHRPRPGRLLRRLQRCARRRGGTAAAASPPTRRCAAATSSAPATRRVLRSRPPRMLRQVARRVGRDVLVTNGAYVLYPCCAGSGCLARHGWNGTVEDAPAAAVVVWAVWCVSGISLAVRLKPSAVSGPSATAAPPPCGRIDPNGDSARRQAGVGGGGGGLGNEVAATVFGCWAVMGSALCRGPACSTAAETRTRFRPLWWRAGAVYNVPTLLFEGGEWGVWWLFVVWELMGGVWCFAF